jgi:hypothetical protein
MYIVCHVSKATFQGFAFPEVYGMPHHDCPALRDPREAMEISGRTIIHDDNFAESCQKKRSNQRFKCTLRLVDGNDDRQIGQILRHGLVI